MLNMMRGAKIQYEASTQMQAEAEALRLICLAGAEHPALKAAQARGASPRVLGVLEQAAPILKAAAPAASTSAAPLSWVRHLQPGPPLRAHSERPLFLMPL